MTGHDVFLILDEDYDGDLAELSSRCHVWIRSSAQNDSRIRAVRDAESDEVPTLRGVTRFQGGGDLLDCLYSTLNTIEDHHGEHAADPPWATIHVLGLSPDDVSPGRIQGAVGASVSIDRGEGSFVIRRNPPPERVPLDMSRLSTASQGFAARLFRALPETGSFARMERADPEGEFDLFVEIPSPTEDPLREVVLWMEDGDEPSVGFGEWHTHSGLWDDGGDSAIDLIRAILADRFVLIYDVGGDYDGDWGVVDLREEDALFEELTSGRSPGRVRVRTWSGRGDREVGLEDLEDRG